MSLIPILTITILIIVGIFFTTFNGSETKINAETMSGMKGANPSKKLGDSCENHAQCDGNTNGNGWKCYRKQCMMICRSGRDCNLRNPRRYLGRCAGSNIGYQLCTP